METEDRAPLRNPTLEDRCDCLGPSRRVENPSPLTAYDPGHPYIVAIYDLEGRLMWNCRMMIQYFYVHTPV